jgi:hypothetical protein
MSKTQKPLPLQLPIEPTIIPNVIGIGSYGCVHKGCCSYDCV